MFVSFSDNDSYHLAIYSNFNVLNNFLRITFTTLSYLVLYTFYAYFQLSLNTWLIVSYLSLHKLRLLFCCVQSIFDLHSWCLWRCFVLLFEKIQFLSQGFPFLAVSLSSRMRFRQFVAWNIHTVVFIIIIISNFFFILLILMLFVLFLVAVISISLLFFHVVFEFSNWCSDAIFNAGESSFFSWHISMSSLVCKVLWSVIRFFVFWSISWSSFLSGPVYLTRETAQVFNTLMRFPQQKLVSRSFLVHLRYLFLASF